MLAVCFLLGGSHMLSAQTLNKKVLLSDLNNSGDTKLTPQQKSDFNASNDKLANDLLNVEKNSKSKAERDKGIDNLFDKRDKDIDKMFGNDTKFNDAKKSMKKNSRSLRAKVKLAKLVV